MTTDLDALIAVLRKGDGNGCRQPNEVMRAAADALESTLAELRQERERADENADAAQGQNDLNRELGAALSRAEKTIDRARAAIGDANEWDGHGRADQLDNTRRILTEYDKQKGAPAEGTGQPTNHEIRRDQP